MNDQDASRDEIEDLEGDMRRAWSRISLQPALEAEFLDRRHDRKTATFLRWHVGAILINLACLPLDNLDGILAAGLLVRLGLVTPLYALGIVILGWGPRRLHGAAIIVPLVAFVSGVFYLGLQVPMSAGDKHLMAAAMLLIGANIIMPLAFRQAVLAVMFSIGALFAMLVSVGELTPDRLGLAGFISGISLISLIVRFQSERSARTAFLLRRRDEIRSTRLLALTAALAEMAETDALTGLPNRRGLTRVLAEKWRDASELKAWISILMIDVDHFKKFNDAAGHEQGDRCLRQVAEALGAQAGNQGHYVARFGGEEFTAILTGLEPEPALEVAESLRRAVERLCLPHPAFEEGCSVTVSVGASVVLPARHISVKDVMAAADKALYDAKEAGRNRVGYGRVSARPAADEAVRHETAAAG